MALVRYTRSCLSMIYGKTSSNMNKLPVLKVQRNFSLSQIRMEKASNMDQIAVDSLSRIALVINGKYKTLKDVPAYLPYGVIYKARDKFRIKASIASGIFLTILMIYLIKVNSGDKREKEYQLTVRMDEARQEKEAKKQQQ